VRKSKAFTTFKKRKNTVGRTSNNPLSLKQMKKRKRRLNIKVSSELRIAVPFVNPACECAGCGVCSSGSTCKRAKERIGNKVRKICQQCRMMKRSLEKKT
jgi:hypothetical protein